MVLAAGWHGIGQLSPAWALGAVFTVIVAAAVAATLVVWRYHHPSDNT